MKHFLILTICFLYTANSILAQENYEDTVSWDKKDLGFQFDYINQKSTSYQEYKVVKKEWILGLKSRTMDTVSMLYKELKLLKEVNFSQDSDIQQLKIEIDSLEELLQIAIKNNESMSFLGINTSKSHYNIVVWLIIGLISFLLILSVVKARKAISAASFAKSALNTVEEEFDGYKRVAIEREQKVRRQLQDEILKQKKGK